MTDIFREVDEDLRHERFNKLWRRFRWWLIGAIVLIIGAAVAYVVITDLEKSRLENEANRFAAALAQNESGQFSSAADSFSALARDGSAGYAALARLRAADSLLEAGDVTGAVALFDQLAGDARADPLYRDLGALLAAEQLLDSVSADEINQRLAPLLVEDNPWRPLAAELSGVAALRAGRVEQARELFVELTSDLTAPAGVQARAGALLASIGGAPTPDSSETTEP